MFCVNLAATVALVVLSLVTHRVGCVVAAVIYLIFTLVCGFQWRRAVVNARVSERSDATLVR